MEIEQALKRILDLENENKLMTDEITSLKVVNEKLNTEIENKDVKINDLKQLNMSYFERLTLETQQLDTNNHVDSKTEEVTTWDDFMSNWN